MAINQEMTKGSQGEWHQDWQGSHRIFNCVVPFGKFTGADLALWQPKVRLQLYRGEAFFFFGALLAHKVMSVESGPRSCVDLFTHESNHDRRRKHPETYSKESYREWDLEKRAAM
jgi:hypothetical protein